MVTEELLSYIKRQQSNRVPEESIRAILLSNGWLKIDVDKAFDSLFKVQESAIATSSDLRTKMDALTPVMSAATATSLSQGSEFAKTSRPSLTQDSYREPIVDNEPKIALSPLHTVSTGTGLTDELRSRLQKISSDSIFAPQKQVVNPVSSPALSTGNPLMMNSLTQQPASFEERLMGGESHNEVALPQTSSSFPIKRETIMSQPLSSLHMIESKPLVEPPPDQNRLYSRFGGSPYSPSMDKFNNPLSIAPVKKSHAGLFFFIFFLMIVGGSGYYLYTYKKDLVQFWVGKLISSQQVMTQQDTTSQDVSTIGNNDTETQDLTPAPETQVPPTPKALPTAESSLKSIAMKVPAYASLKSTTKGVCSNVSSGIAKDMISLKQSYGSSATCVDDANSFAVTIPYQTTGEFMCIDASQEIVLVKAIPKVARCI